MDWASPLIHMNTQDKSKLIAAITDFDRRASRKAGHNPYALGIYFERVDAIFADIEAGADVRAAIVAGFTGRICDVCLRALGLPVAQDKEHFGKAWHYQPVKLEA